MLDKPDISESLLVTRLQEAYGLCVAEIAFLPLGADANAAVYRVRTDKGTAYFLKLRQGVFDEITVTLPRFLAAQGVQEIMASLPTEKGQLWTELNTFRILLYPFVEGQNGFETDLTKEQWSRFGTALRRVHDMTLTSELAQHLPVEDYSSRFRESVRNYLREFAGRAQSEPLRAQLSAILKTRRSEIETIVDRAEQLAAVLIAAPPSCIVCHTDIHAGNVLITGEEIYLVDWDSPRFAPKERDLMYVGGGIGGALDRANGAVWFYQGYGETDVNKVALTYYRYERIAEDIAVMCANILSPGIGEANRQQELRYLAENFAPGSVVEIAHATYERIQPRT